VASVKTSLAARPDAIETRIDPVSLAIQVVGAPFMTQCLLTLGASIQTAVDAIAPDIPALFDAIAAVNRVGRAGERQQYEQQQGQGGPGHCFHRADSFVWWQ
jgi:hypothetical protein